MNWKEMSWQSSLVFVQKLIKWRWKEVGKRQSSTQLWRASENQWKITFHSLPFWKCWKRNPNIVWPNIQSEAKTMKSSWSSKPKFRSLRSIIKGGCWTVASTLLLTDISRQREKTLDFVTSVANKFFFTSRIFCSTSTWLFAFSLDFCKNGRLFSQTSPIRIEH